MKGKKQTQEQTLSAISTKESRKAGARSFGKGKKGKGSKKKPSKGK